MNAMSDPRTRPVEILLVEDSPGDVRLTQECLREARIANTLHVVGDGEEALEFLRREGRFSGMVRPDLILLDLNLPRMDGRELLAVIKRDEQLRRIPVVVLTVSRDEADILKTYDLHANCYIVKPMDFAQFLKVVRSIEDFWLTVVRLPKNGAAG
jgi:CheY-like chemotaxis protein